MLRATAVKERDFLNNLLRSIQEANLGPGSRLPVEREQMIEFGVSRTTVRRALRRLEEARLIERCQGSGTYLRAAPTNAMVRRVLQGEERLGRISRKVLSHKTYRIAMLHDRVQDDPVIQQILKGVTGYAESRGHTISIGHSRPDSFHPGPDVFSEEVLRPSADGIIVIATFSAADQKPLAAVRAPYVLLADEPVANALSIDIPAFCRQGVGELVARGHSRIAVVEKQYGGLRPGLEHVCCQLREELELPKLRYFWGEDPARDALRQRRPPSALLVKDDFYCCKVLERLEAAGLVLGRDIEVISYANRDLNPGLPASIGRIEFDLEDFGRRAAQLLERRLEDPSVVIPSTRVGARFIPGRSPAFTKGRSKPWRSSQ